MKFFKVVGSKEEFQEFIQRISPEARLKEELEFDFPTMLEVEIDVRVHNRMELGRMIKVFTEWMEQFKKEGEDDESNHS